MWLDWEIAAKVAIALVALLVVLRTVLPGRVRPLVAISRELALMFGLYAFWQYVRSRAITKVVGAHEHALSLFRFEQRIHLPNELSLQHAVLHSSWLTQALNGFYATAHVPAVGALLVWLYVCHRDRYGEVRNVLALLIAGCLAIQTIPVAPPRLLGELGFIDTGLRYGQSVYGTGGSGISNQLAAMPSMHVGWSVLVGVTAVTIGTSRWRWVVLAHPVVTVVAVVATGNHWWMDGIVAVGLLGLAYGVVQAAERVANTLRATSTAERAREVIEPQPTPAD